MNELEKLIEWLKQENPYVHNFDCLNCSNSFSTDSDELICVATDDHKTVDFNHICKDFC